MSEYQQNDGYQQYPYTPPEPEPPSAGEVMECLRFAWNDVRYSPNWVTRCLLLGIIQIVPILNFIVDGYGIRWGCEIVRKRHEPLSDNIFQKGAFRLGFFAFVVLLVFGLVSSIVCGALNFVPILGSLVSLFVTVFFVMFTSLVLIRMGLFERLGAGFDIAKCWNKFKFSKNWGSLFCGTVIPAFVAVVITTIVASIVGLIAMLVFGMGIAVTSAFDLPSFFLVGDGAASGILAIVAWIFASLTGAVAKMVAYRATGYWVSRVAPEWLHEVRY